MARKVDEIPRLDQHRTKNHKYPWDDWLDGSVWELTAGEDFDLAIDSFRTSAHNAAQRRGLGMTCRRDGIKKLYIQAILKGNQ